MSEENKEREQGQVPNKKEKKFPIAVVAMAVILVLAIGGGITYYATSASPAARFREQLDLANRYLEELDYEQAVAAFKAAIEIDPKNEDAYLGLAEAYAGLGDYESAVEAIEEGIEQTGAEALEAYLEEILAERAETQAAGDGGAEAGQEEADTEQDMEDGETEAEQGTTQDTEDEETEARSLLGIEEVTAGQIITFGSYEQDGNTANGKEPIEWYVLEASGGEAVLLSVYLLDCKPYNEMDEDITWENCTLRSWLNSEFYNTAFSAEEQLSIINTNVVNEDNPYHGTEGGNDTVDKVWLLSLGEIERYFHIDRWNGNMNWGEYVVYCYGQDHRVCTKPTAYAEAYTYVHSEEGVQYYLDEYGIDVSYAVGSSWWWLRSPGVISRAAAPVSGGGGVDNYGNEVDSSLGVRPALKVVY